MFRKAISKSSRKIRPTRLETWATPGVPDVVLCDEKGGFHFVEMKATAGKAVELSGHQVAWLTNHSHASVWVLVLKVKTRNTPQRVLLYHGWVAMDLKLEGMAVKPLYECEGNPDWEEILGLICPREAHKIA